MRMNRSMIKLAMTLVAVMVICIPGGPLRAQSSQAIHQDNGGLNGSLSHEDLERMSGDQTQASKSARETAAAQAKAMTQSALLIKALQISCELDNAQLVVSGTRPAAAGGKKVDTRVYEVACKGGVGYLLETQGAETPAAVSCIAAEEARAADVAKGKEPGFFCKLPENHDVYALVASMIHADTGAECGIDVLRSLGRSESTQSSYSEIKCKDGTGFLLRLPLPGSQAAATAMSCADAAKQGVKCHLTEVAAAAAETHGGAVTVETFKAALKNNGVACDVAQVRLIGQEDHRKRYVVEYLCADASLGAVAFIPLEGNTNPFESMDCDEALLDRIPCSLTRVK